MAASIILASLNQPQLHISPMKVVTAIVLVSIWLWVTAWVDKDAARFRFSGIPWTATNFALTLIGTLAMVFMANFIVSLSIFVGLCLIAFFSFVYYHNSKVNEAYKIFTAEWFSNLFSGQAKKIHLEVKVPLYDKQGSPLMVTEEHLNDPMFVEGYTLAQELLIDGACKRASEVAIDPTPNGASVRYMVDGLLTQQPPLPIEESNLIIDFLKELSGLNVKDSSKQQSKFAMNHAGGKVEIEISTAANKMGRIARLKFMQEAAQTKLDELGLPKKSLEILVENIADLGKSGVILVTGLPKTGVTSTAYSLMRKQDAFMKELITIEKKPSVDLDNITQHTYGTVEELNQSFASNIRHEPDVVMLDTVGDATTVEQINEFAKEKLVIATMPATEAAEGVARWKKLGGDINLLKIVTCQYLIRKICENCKQPYKPAPELLQKMRLPANVPAFYRPAQPPANPKEPYEPCSVCQEIGYIGRTGVFEVLVMNDTLRQAVTQGKSVSDIRTIARKSGKMLTLQEQTYIKVAQGATTIDEAQRAIKAYAAQIQQLKGGK